jgi:hypothetical protein
MAWYNPIDWFTGIDAEVARGQELDKKISDLNQQKVIEGSWTQQDYDNYSRNNEWASNYREQVDKEFFDGAAAGWDRMTAPIGKAIDAGAKAAGTLITLQFLLAAGAIYLAYRYFLAKR